MKKEHKEYTLGLDLGTNSVGWACINEETRQILNAGVRIFDIAENPKTGESLAKPRREARLTRRRLQRRRHRLDQILKLLLNHQFITNKQEIQTAHPINLWILRIKGLDYLLDNNELSRIIYHIGKHRGFKSSKKELDDTQNTELTKANKDMNEVFLAFKNSGYRTIAEYMYYTYNISHKNIRNKLGTYTNLIKQDINEQELRLILEKQKEFGNLLITEDFVTTLLDIFTYRKGLPSFESKVGDCTLEQEPYTRLDNKDIFYKRAPKDALSSSLFRAWSDLNHIRYQKNIDAPNQVLMLEQRERLIKLAFDKAQEGKKITESQINEIIGAGIIENGDEKNKKIKKYLINFDISKIMKSLSFSSYTKLKKVCQELDIWAKIEQNNDLIDAVIYCIAYLKEFKNLATLQDPIIKELMMSLEFSEGIWQALFDSLSFDGTMSLSLPAMWKLLPYYQLDNEFGIPLTYDKCVEEVYPGLFHDRSTQDSQYVPKFNDHDITSPVVKRTLNQTRLLINKLISIYGKPQQINIELARDLGKSKSDRKKIENQNIENKNKNERNVQEARELGIQDFIAYRLWKEQSGQCVYSGRKISPDDMKYNRVEVDHILPISRSGDDSLMNKVVVFSDENQRKGNKTAFEYLSSKGNAALEDYKIRMRGIKTLRYRKRDRLLLEDFDRKSQEYKTRHLNDARYIAKLLTSHLDKTIRPKNQKYGYIKTLPGQATSVLRKLWGFRDKVREESHTHHAFDAILIAGAGSKIEQWEKDITNILQYRYKEDRKISLGERAQRNIERFGFDVELPWENFAEDARRYIDENVFVSRLGKRKVNGEMHAQTIMSHQKNEQIGERIVKTIILQNIGKEEKEVLKKLEDMVDVSIAEDGTISGRNANVYRVIVEHAKKFNWDMAQAFNIENAPPMPVKKENPNHVPVIRKIKISASASSKLQLQKMSSEKRQAAVDSGNLIRLDLFRDHMGKFFVVPVYPFHYQSLPEPDETRQAQFIFSIYKNDYLVFESDKSFVINGASLKTAQGYWNTYANPTRITLIPHNNNSKFKITITTMNSIKKYYIDMFGKRHLIASSNKPEAKRLSLKEVEAKIKDARNKR
ncbi:MAG: type II CRISPR RNA-guided endonuclease Cas9 [Brevinema sp.]